MRNATRICFIYQLWLINITKACCISNIRTQIYSTFFQYVKEHMPTNWQWDCLRICYIFKMKVLVECSTATFPYGSWRLEFITTQKTIYIATGLYRSFCHRSFGFNIITIFQNYGGAKRNRTADLCKPPCSALPLS